MDRSFFLARLMGPAFVVIALGMLINLGMYESMKQPQIDQTGKVSLT